MALGAQLDMTPRFSRDGAPLHQMSALGTFSEELVCPEISTVKIDADVPFTSAALDRLRRAHRIRRRREHRRHRARATPSRSSVAVVSASTRSRARSGRARSGSSRSTASTRSSTWPKQFGATDLVNATNGDPVAQVQELTGGRGVDVSFEVIGLKDTVQQAFAMARRGGQAIIVGVPKMEQIMEIPIAMELLVNEKQVRGSWYGSSDVQRDVPRLVALYKDGTLKLDELVSRTIGLDGINDAFTVDGSGRGRPIGRRLRDLRTPGSLRTCATADWVTAISSSPRSVSAPGRSSPTGGAAPTTRTR